jgi:DNA-binding MarR family transcriptional regulator
VAEERAVSGEAGPDDGGREHGSGSEAVASATRRLWSVDGDQGAGDESDGPLELDRVIHERVRLGIVSALAVNGTLSFTDLREILNTTDGNLSAHARRLEEAGYLECTKSFEGRMPRTEYALTARGRRKLQAYLDHMEALIRAMRPQP